MKRPFVWALMAIVLAGGVGIAWWVISQSSGRDASWLFSHTADGGSLTDNGDGTYTLTLTGIDPHLLAFTDRPNRDAVVVDAAGLVGMWEAFFADSDPNAVLVEHTPDKDADSVVMTLSDPSLGDERLTFTAIPLVDEAPSSLAMLVGSVHSVLPTQFSSASLFIDDAAPGSDCIDGVACESPVEQGILCDLGYSNCQGVAGNGGNGGEGGPLP